MGLLKKIVSMTRMFSPISITPKQSPVLGETAGKIPVLMSHPESASGSPGSAKANSSSARKRAKAPSGEAVGMVFAPILPQIGDVHAIIIFLVSRHC